MQAAIRLVTAVIKFKTRKEMLGHPVKVNLLDVLLNVKLVILVTLLYLCYTTYTTETMNGRIYTNFESNLAMTVIYLPVKFVNSIGQSVFELESRNGNVDGQTNGQKMDKQTDRITPISKGTQL